MLAAHLAFSFTKGRCGSVQAVLQQVNRQVPVKTYICKRLQGVIPLRVGLWSSKYQGPFKCYVKISVFVTSTFDNFNSV